MVVEFNLAVSMIGKSLKPLTDMLLTTARDILQWYNKTNPILRDIISFVVSLAPVIIGLSIAFAFMKIALVPLAGAITGLGKAFGFLAANPIIAGILAVAGAAWLLWEYWDEVSWALQETWNLIKKVFEIGFKFIKTIFLNFTPLGIIIKNWDPIVAHFKKIWDRIKKIWEPAKKFFKGLFDYLPNFGGKITARGGNAADLFPVPKPAAGKPPTTSQKTITQTNHINVEVNGAKDPKETGNEVVEKTGEAVASQKIFNAFDSNVLF